MTKAKKYCLFLIIGLLLMYFAFSIIMLLMAIPVKKYLGISLSDFSLYLSTLQSINSNEFSETLGMTWAEYAKIIFADTVLFENMKLTFVVSQLLSYVPILIIFFYFLRSEFKEDWLKFKQNIKQNLIIIVLSFCAMIFLANAVAIIYGLLGDTGSSDNEDLINLLLGSNGKWFMIIAIVICAPIVEEVVYRKLLIGTCEETFKMSPMIAIIISALIFSFIHVSDLENIKYIFQYLALAIPMCVGYHLSGNNIFVTIIVHAANNFLGVIAYLVILL